MVLSCGIQVVLEVEMELVSSSRELIDRVVEVRRKSDRIMSIKLVLGVVILNVICVYAPQMGLSEDVKRAFWEELEDVLHSIPRHEELFVGEISMGILERRPMGMLEHMEVSGMGRGTVEELHFWILL